MLKNNPLITVYITNYNYGNFIKKAIKSVLNQSFKDFELIIIDDGSKDKSIKIIKEFENKKNIKIVIQKNKGLIVSNNLALRLSRAKYIMRLDSDDWLDPYALEIMSNVLERNKKISLVFPDYYEVNKNGKILKQIIRHDFNKVKLLDQPAHGACTMIRKENLIDIGGYDEEFSCQDGYYLWLKFIKKYMVKNINLPLFYYRQHEKNLTKG
jgi:glycosyltransferase involved in cell wall biosynthesis